MTKIFYTSSIFILGVFIAAGLLQNGLYLLLGGQIFMMESFWGWFLVTNIIALVGAYLSLKYLHYRQYYFTFFAGILSAVVTLAQSVIFYIILNKAILQNLYIPVVFLAVGTGILYAVSLIFSDARERPWLKMTGVSILILNIVLLVALIWTVSSQDGSVRTALEKVMQWTVLVGSLIPLLLIMNLLNEIRDLKTKNEDAPLRRSSESLWGLTQMITLCLVITFGVLLARESQQSLYWRNKNVEKTNEFAQLCENRTFTNSKGKTLSYLLMRPLDYDPRQKYPLVVALPYGGYEAPPAQILA
ncbi:MAG: hypothetical protein C0490_28300, partial [Marivirga sp.]|nr:hypothetical protein [Marivirga sp.]